MGLGHRSICAAAAAAMLLGAGWAAAARTPARPASTGEAHAAAVVRAQGYSPNRPDEWTPGNVLNALTATATGSADGYNQRAFFFARGRFVGVDAPEPSAQITEIWSDGDTVAVLYLLYRAADPLCCPTAGGRIVRFQWSGTRLQVMGHVPPTRGPVHR